MKAGDLVNLKSGSPDMVLIDVVSVDINATPEAQVFNKSILPKVLKAAKVLYYNSTNGNIHESVLPALALIRKQDGESVATATFQP
jgi:hypothetical protein